MERKEFVPIRSLTRRINPEQSLQWLVNTDHVQQIALHCRRYRSQGNIYQFSKTIHRSPFQIVIAKFFNGSKLIGPTLYRILSP